MHIGKQFSFYFQRLILIYMAGFDGEIVLPYLNEIDTILLLEIKDVERKREIIAKSERWLG